MPLVIANSKRIFFAHIPKTGGSSVEDYLVRRFGGPLSLVDVTEGQGDKFRGLIVPSTHLSARDLDDVLPRDTDHFFAVVRDPLSRIESQFRFQDGVSKTRFFSFSTWLRIMVASTKLDPRAYHNHTRPQVDLIPDGSRIFRLEDGLDEMVKWLDSVVGEFREDVSVGHLLKREKQPIKIYKQDIELILDFYSADYERFGYETPDISQYQKDYWALARTILGRSLAHLVIWRQHRRWVK